MLPLVLSAALAATLSLPPDQAAAAWSESLDRADFTLAGVDAQVRIEVHGDAWWLVARAEPCTAYLVAPATTMQARDALLAAARVLVGSEPLPRFDDAEPPPPPPPPVDPAVACPSGPRVVAMRPSAPADKPVAAPPAWRADDAPPPRVRRPALVPPPPPRPDVLVVRAGFLGVSTELGGAAGVRAGFGARFTRELSMGVDAEVQVPAPSVLVPGVDVGRQYLGVRTSWGRGLRLSMSAGAALVELDGPRRISAVVWQPRAAIDGEVCGELPMVDVCVWAGVAGEPIPVVLTVEGAAVGTLPTSFLRVGLSAEVPVKRTPWRLE